MNRYAQNRDLNARVGRRATPDPIIDIQPHDTIGPCSLKGDIVPNENGALLIDIASDNNLRHIGSHFVCRDSKRWTWRHPRYGSRAVLDHVFLPAAQMRLVCRNFVVPTVSVSTDHRLLVTELCFRPRIHKVAQVKTPNLDKRVLQNPVVKEAFQSEIANTLGGSDPAQLSTEELSRLTRSAPVAAAKKVLTVVTRILY